MDISILAGVLAGNMGVRVAYSDEAPTFMVGKDDNGPVLIISTRLAGINGDQVESLNTMLRGALAHECVGHLRFTDMDRPVPQQPLLRALTNALEDVRIEFLAPTAYPGARRALREMVEELEAREFWAPEKKDRLENAILMWLLRTLRTQVLQQPLRADWTQHFERVVRAQFGDAVCDQAMKLALTAHRQPDTAHVESLARQILALFVQNSPTPATEASQDSEDAEGEDAEASQAPSEGKDRDAPEDNNGDAESSAKEASDESGDDDGEPDEGDRSGDPAGDSDDSDSLSAQADAPSSGPSSGDEANGSPSDGSSGDEATDAQAPHPQSSQDGEAGQEASSGQERAGKGPGRGRSPRLVLDLDAPTREVSPEDAVKSLLADHCSYAGSGIIPPVDWSDMQPITAPVPVSSLAHRMRESLRRSLYSLRDDEDDAPSDRGRLHVPALPEAWVGRSPAFLEDGQPAEGLDTHLTLLVDMSGSMTDLTEAVGDMMLAIGDAASAFEGDGLQWALVYFNCQPAWIKKTTQPWARVRNYAYAQYDPQDVTLWPECVAPLIVDAAQSRRKRKVILTITDGDLGNQTSAASVLKSAQRHHVEMAFVGVGVRLNGYGIQADYTDNTPESVIKAVTGALQRVMRPSYA